MDPKFTLDTNIAYRLADEMKRATDKKVSRRLLAISLRHFGYPVEEIGRITGVSSRSVTNWLRRFQDQGLDGLMRLDYPTDRGSRLEAHQEAIQAYVIKNPKAKIGEIQQWLSSERGVTVEVSWLYRYVKKRKAQWMEAPFMEQAVSQG